jgi:hypothetical protein
MVVAKILVTFILAIIKFTENSQFFKSLMTITPFVIVIHVAFVELDPNSKCGGTS